MLILSFPLFFVEILHFFNNSVSVDIAYYTFIFFLYFCLLLECFFEQFEIFVFLSSIPLKCLHWPQLVPPFHVLPENPHEFHWDTVPLFQITKNGLYFVVICFFVFIRNTTASKYVSNVSGFSSTSFLKDL